MRRWISLFFLVSLILAGCGGSQPAEEDLLPPDPQAPPLQEQFTSTPEDSIQLGNTPEAPDMTSNPPPVEKFIDLAKKDLVDKLQIDATTIDLTKTEETLWLNAALGCPAPGKVYAQGRVPGFRIWLSAGGVEYDYHTDWLGQVILCTVPGLEDNPSLPSTTDPTPQIGVPIK